VIQGNDISVEPPVEDTIRFEEYFSYQTERWIMEGNWNAYDSYGGTYKLSLEKTSDTVVNIFGSKATFHKIEVYRQMFDNWDKPIRESNFIVYFGEFDGSLWQLYPHGLAERISLSYYFGQNDSTSTIFTIKEKQFRMSSTKFIWGITLRHFDFDDDLHWSTRLELPNRRNEYYADGVRIILP
jgi:hypothetical protein